MSISKFRSFLFRLNSVLGDVQAVKKGPSAIVKRIIRKNAHKITGRIINDKIK